jgi:hypothetical protein
MYIKGIILKLIYLWFTLYFSTHFKHNWKEFKRLFYCEEIDSFFIVPTCTYLWKSSDPGFNIVSWFAMYTDKLSGFLEKIEIAYFVEIAN